MASKSRCSEIYAQAPDALCQTPVMVVCESSVIVALFEAIKSIFTHSWDDLLPERKSRSSPADSGGDFAVDLLPRLVACTWA